MSDEPRLWVAPADGVRLVADYRHGEGWYLWFNWKEYGDPWGTQLQQEYGPLGDDELDQVITACLEALPKFSSGA